MAYGYTAQNRTARELETATTDAVNLIEELEEKVGSLETKVEHLTGLVDSAEEDVRALEEDIDRMRDEK